MLGAVFGGVLNVVIPGCDAGHPPVHIICKIPSEELVPWPRLHPFHPCPAPPLPSPPPPFQLDHHAATGSTARLHGSAPAAALTGPA